MIPLTEAEQEACDKLYDLLREAERAELKLRKAASGARVLANSQKKVVAKLRDQWLALAERKITAL